MKNKNDFEYKYIAPTANERREIESIRNSYLPSNKSVSKLDYLRKLDSKVRNIPMIMSLFIGVIGTLLFGLGLTMILEWSMNLMGVVVCTIGIIPVSFAYLTFKMVKKYLNNKYLEKIIKLSDELLNN